MLFPKVISPFAPRITLQAKRGPFTVLTGQTRHMHRTSKGNSQKLQLDSPGSIILSINGSLSLNVLFTNHVLYGCIVKSVGKVLTLLNIHIY